MVIRETDWAYVIDWITGKVLWFVGVILLVLVGLAIASIVIYSRSQRRETDDRLHNTPINDIGEPGDHAFEKKTVVDSTSVSPNSHPINEKSVVGMSASLRGVTHSSTSASERNQ